MKNINLTIEKGKSLSIVGLNGQGETTLIKLLCRLYDNYTGDIFYGDTNIQVNKKSISNMDQIEKILPKGVTLDTVYSKELDVNGVELSGGESQKVAIARMINKNGSIMILDEPTASLDAKAESKLLIGKFQKKTKYIASGADILEREWYIF